MPAKRLTLFFYVIIAVQGACTLFFLWDIAGEFGLQGPVESTPKVGFHIYSELIVSVGLLTGLLLGLVLLTRLQAERKKIESRLQVAAGAFAEVVHARFDEWGLTAAERDVALYTIKGYSLGEIAGFRGKSESTIKAQSTAIYRKANVTRRTHLISMFIEDLIDDPVAVV